ncbi:MAG: alpha/beta fold hydrolase [Planctomycetes bacterium]|nr:alpha/beta fold hydrolase [Planctomycetota bacterium]
MSGKRKKIRQFVRHIVVAILKVIIVVITSVLRVLMIPVFSPRIYRKCVSADGQQGSSPKRRKWYWPNPKMIRVLSRGIALRLLELPVVILFCVFVVVYSSVHPPTDESFTLTPEGMGLYTEAVNFTSQDGSLLNGWYIPSLNAAEVLEEGDLALLRKRPGVVLCHGIGATREQLLGLAAYLNSRGAEVLLFDFRSCGLSENSARSFGINERDDVLAAVNFLRSINSVDPQKIIVIGQDMGAVAALRAAGLDHTIAAVVMADAHADLRSAVSMKLAGTGVGNGAFNKALTTSFMWGCKTYFSASDEHFSTTYAASRLFPSQSLMLVARQKNQELKDAADHIERATNANTRKLIVNKVGACVLNDMDVVAPAIGNLMDSLFNDNAKTHSTAPDLQLAADLTSQSL